MAARWAALALACQLLLAAAVAAPLLAASGPSGPVAVLALAELGGVALLLAVAPLVLARSMASACVPRSSMRCLAVALCRDALAFEAALARMALEPWRAPPDEATGFDPTLPRPVLLVHGFACSRAVWRPLLARLRAAGVGPVRAVSLEPALASIDAYAAELLGELDALGSRAGGHAITIVAHSMGGLVARAALRGARPGVVGRIITLGTPHHGTALACRFQWPNARQMCLGSSWLMELNTRQEGRLEVPLTSVYSLDDNYVVPAQSARLNGARTIELQGLGHLSLLESKAALEQVMAELLE